MDPTKTSPPQEAKLHFLDYWRIIRIRKTVILAVFLLVVLTATLVTFILPEFYASTARIRIERDQPDIQGVQNSGFIGGYDPYYIQTEFEVIQSEVVLGKVVDDPDLDLIRRWGKKYNSGQPLTRNQAIDLLKGYVDLRPARNTSIIEIRVMSDDKDEAARIANAVADAYKEHRLATHTELTLRGIEALKAELKEHAAKVTEAQGLVDGLRATLKISDPDPMSSAPAPTLSVEEVRQIQMRMREIMISQVQLETQLQRLQELSPAQLRSAIQTAVGSDPELGVLLTDFNMAQARLLVLARDYQPEHEVYKNARMVAEDLEKRVTQRVDGILVGLQTRVDAGKAAIKVLEQQLVEAKEKDVEMAEGSRPYFSAKQNLAELLQFRQILGMRIAAQETDRTIPREAMVTITDRAVPGKAPVRPNKLLNIVLGIVIGLVVGVGLAFFIEYLDTSVKTIDDVERTLQAPVLGVIPQNVGFLMEEGAESPHAEAYRVLRTNLLFSRKDEKLNTVAVVSAGAGEGKSTTVFNLATVFAQNGGRVVIVDSDLRRPTLHKMLRVTNSIGLTNYLLKQSTLEEVIQRTSLPTLDFMASGRLPSSSMGILSSTQMRALITELKQRYDFVFFDSPPIMGVSDASILASEVDLTLQVIQYRRYPQPMNIRAKQMIEKVGGNLLGIVLNNINMSQDESYYYYSGYYHEYYSRNEEETDGAARTDSGDKGNLDIQQKY